MKEKDREIIKKLQEFQPVTLNELDDLRLMVRQDRKFIFHFSQLHKILDAVKESYKVLEIEGLRSQYYTTSYFDTPHFDLYLMHHRGKLNRQKIRMRNYNSGGASFLEVKRKSNLGVTNKSRVAVKSIPAKVLNDEETFLTKFTPFKGDQLVNSLNNEFNRITLVNFISKERITLDYGIKLNRAGEDEWIGLDGICIAEIKRAGNFYKSLFAKTLKVNRIYPMRFSKYCYGVAKLVDSVPKNRFKEKFKKVDKINAIPLNNTY